MRNTTLLFVLLVLLSGPAQAHHGGPHQNDTPMAPHSVDCSKVASYVRRWDILQQMLQNHGKALTEDEDKDLHNAKELFSIYCFEA